MLSLGIDPGTASIGWGFVRERPDGTLEALDYGVIRTGPEDPMPKRLQQIFQSLTALICKYQPDQAGVEELFFAKNVTTAITVAQGRGVILLALQQSGIPIHEYKPNMVKQTISGYGGAGKPQIQEMVRILLNMEDTPRPDDAADALAIAITDLQMGRYRQYDMI